MIIKKLVDFTSKFTLKIIGVVFSIFIVIMSYQAVTISSLKLKNERQRTSIENIVKKAVEDERRKCTEVLDFNYDDPDAVDYELQQNGWVTDKVLT